MTRDEFEEHANTGDHVEVIGRHECYGRQGVIIRSPLGSHVIEVKFDDNHGQRLIGYRNLKLLKIERKLKKVLKVWTNTIFEGRFPDQETAALVVAETAERAAELLNVVLHQQDLIGRDVLPKDMVEVNTSNEVVILLSTGDD